MKNYIKQSFGLVLIVFVVLVGLSFFVTEFTLFGHTFKPVNLFSDVEKEAVDTTSAGKKVKPQFVDTCKTGITCFEDYSKDKNALNNFLDALLHLDSTKQTAVRIGYFGDSFIEGDIITAYLRDSLQSLYGGHGVGLMPVTSMVNQFRQTVTHNFNGFTTYTALEGKPATASLGFACNTFVPAAGATVNFGAVKSNPRLSRFNCINIYYRSGANTTVSCNINSKGAQSYTLAATKKVGLVQIKKDSIRNAAFSFGGGGEIYGIALEDTTGISVDNLSLRGNSGMALLNVEEDMLAEFDSLRNYKLIVLQYGLNVAAEGTTKFTAYENNMIKVINRIKKNCPGATILLVSVSDRSTKKNGEYVTMTSIPLLVESQRRIASETGIAFWNLFEAMGGQKSMVTYADNGWANKDYTHLKFSGGKQIAKILMETILYEKYKYVEKKKSL